jgi:hypothetical protein
MKCDAWAKKAKELEEKLKNNLEETEECCPIETAEAAWNMSEVSEVEGALKDLKREVSLFQIAGKALTRGNLGNSLSINYKHLANAAQNLVDALEGEKNQKKLGLNAIFPNAEYVYSESNLDIPEPTITFQTPDQPELGHNSPTWSDVSKQEPKVDNLLKAWEVEKKPFFKVREEGQFEGSPPTKETFARHEETIKRMKEGLKEECVESVSIWKDVSELPEIDHDCVICTNRGNMAFAMYQHTGKSFTYQVDETDGSVSNGSIKPHEMYKYTTLTDFVNQVEAMEARLRKLEGK